MSAPAAPEAPVGLPPVLLGFLLPLGVGLLNTEAMQEMDRSGLVGVAFLLGYNGIFALGGAVLAGIFAAKRRMRLAWAAVAIATLLSLVLTLASGPTRTRVAAVLRAQSGAEFRAWQEGPGQRTEMTLDKGGIIRRADKTPSVRLLGTLRNDTDEKIIGWIIDLGFSRQGGVEKPWLVTRRFLLMKDIYPTVTMTLDARFTTSAYEGASALNELIEAQSQLGEDSQLRYAVLAAIPARLAGELPEEYMGLPGLYEDRL